MSAHTPGKWLREGRTVYELNERGTNRWSAHVQDAHAHEAELLKVARLIAAAPQLLRACVLVSDVAPHIAAWMAEHDPAAYRQVRAAVALAIGEAA